MSSYAEVTQAKNDLWKVLESAQAADDQEYQIGMRLVDSAMDCPDRQEFIADVERVRTNCYDAKQQVELTERTVFYPHAAAPEKMTAAAE